MKQDLCDYCMGEGCTCGTSDSGTLPMCECAVMGVSKCSECGCDAQPWWADIDLPGGEGVRNMMWDTNGDDGFFPASKEKLVKAIRDAGEDSTWLVENLPDQAYQNTSDIASALTRNLPPIASQQGAADLIWKHPAQALCGGQELIVGDNQQTVLVSRTNRACDSFAPGRYAISRESCPKLASESRKSVPGFNRVVLSGSAIFFMPSKELEIDLSVTGQTRALRRVMAKGVARVRIFSPREFFEQIAAKNQFRSEGTLAGLKRYCDDTVKKEMLSHEMDELSGNGSLLETPLRDSLSRVGLEPVSVSFSFVGDMGPGAFMQAASSMKGGGGADQKNLEQMKQLMESMRATQMARMQAVQQQLAQQNKQTAQANTMIVCASCGTSNPQATKFCGNCGKLLQAQQAKKTCPKCGNQSDPSIKFCGSCGTKLG